MLVWEGWSFFQKVKNSPFSRLYILPNPHLAFIPTLLCSLQQFKINIVLFWEGRFGEKKFSGEKLTTYTLVRMVYGNLKSVKEGKYKENSVSSISYFPTLDIHLSMCIGFCP